MHDRRSWLLNLGRTGSMQGVIWGRPKPQIATRGLAGLAVGRIGIGAVQHAIRVPGVPPAVRVLI